MYVCMCVCMYAMERREERGRTSASSMILLCNVGMLPSTSPHASPVDGLVGHLDAPRDMRQRNKAPFPKMEAASLEGTLGSRRCLQPSNRRDMAMVGTIRLSV